MKTAETNEHGKQVRTEGNELEKITDNSGINWITKQNITFSSFIIEFRQFKTVSFKNDVGEA